MPYLSPFFFLNLPESFRSQVLKAADIAVEDGKLEDSASMIAQARLLFERGGASAKELVLADQVQARLLNAMETREAMTRGLEALSAGRIIFASVMQVVSSQRKKHSDRVAASASLRGAAGWYWPD
jgi:hypothetical protein